MTSRSKTGVLRTAHWMGFHAALAAGAIFAFFRLRRDDRSKLTIWLAFSFVAVCLGARFAPHYFLQLLPPLVIAASRGIVLAFREYRTRIAVALALLLLVPFIRFGPRYVSLAMDDLLDREPRWSDVVMDLDSQHAAQQIRALAHPGDTLFVWGYRPDIYVYTRMTSASRFWDSQPLTGVPADRHLYATTAIYGGPAAANRRELVQSRSDIHCGWTWSDESAAQPERLPGNRTQWMEAYQLVARTKLCLIYRRVK